MYIYNITVKSYRSIYHPSRGQRERLDGAQLAFFIGYSSIYLLVDCPEYQLSTDDILSKNYFFKLCRFLPIFADADFANIWPVIGINRVIPPQNYVINFTKLSHLLILTLPWFWSTLYILIYLYITTCLQSRVYA